MIGLFYITHYEIFQQKKHEYAQKEHQQEVFPEGIRNQIGNCHDPEAHNICKTEREKETPVPIL